MNSIATSPTEEIHTKAAVRYYGWFDWLRFVLATTVLCYHEGLFRWKDAGGFAVQVFFALSGWLIGGILCRTEQSGMKRFYFNRALRIWCPYFLAFVFLIAASLFHDRITAKWFEIVFYKITFVYNLFGPPQLAHYAALMPLQGTGNHFWSVNAEEQFYLISPLLLVFLPRKVGRSVITWGVLAILALITHVYAPIVLGVLAAVCAYHFGPFNDSVWCRIGSLAVVLASAVALAAGLSFEYFGPLCGIGVVLFLAFPARPTAIGAFAGGLSYQLYLNAWVVGVILNAIWKHFHITSRPLHVVLGTLLAIVFAGFLYQYFDRRILAQRQRLYTPGRATAVVYVAYGAAILGCAVGVTLKFLR